MNIFTGQRSYVGLYFSAIYDISYNIRNNCHNIQ